MRLDDLLRGWNDITLSQLPMGQECCGALSPHHGPNCRHITPEQLAEVRRRMAEDAKELSIDEVLAEARRNSLTRDNPLLSDLPGFFSEFRDHQRIAIREILTAYEEGAECVVLDAPTGSGKTLIGESVRRLIAGNGYRQEGNNSVVFGQGSRQSTYICSSKSLQDQFIRDYPYAKVLKGRSNYATEGYPERFGGRDGLSCADCTKSPGQPDSCMWCVSTTDCPYEQAKGKALQSSLAVLNTSYFLSECNGPGRFSRGGFVIADEADVLESELMSHVEVRISERRLKGYGLSCPSKVTVESSWIEWADEAFEKVSTSSRGRVLQPDDIKAVREHKRHAQLCERLKFLRDELRVGGWVYTGDRNQVAFKPVTVDRVGRAKLWSHGGRWLLMSATVISADEMLESLGWDEDKEWRLVKVPSTFPPENRKVVVWPVANMVYKEKGESYPKMVAGVVCAVGTCPEARVLIHSTSYELTRYLHDALEHLPRPVFSYSSVHDKDQAMADYLDNENSVLIAPSMDRGIDLPGDKCRVQIICKVPWLSLKDKQVSARRYTSGGSLWYNVQAIRTIIQMCGRAVRSEDDWCTTYVLDAQFVNNLWGSSKRLFPQWFKEAIVWRMKGL